MTDIQTRLDSELDATYEAQESLQAMIDARVADYLKNDDSVEQLICDNSDVIWSILKSGQDVQDKIMKSLRHWVENEVEDSI